MSTARSRAWLGFGATAAVLLAVVSWLTVVLLRLDHDESLARRQAAMHERLRLALWRMDSWLSPQLAREAMRPASEFRAFPSAATAWTRGFSRLAPDEVVVRSPLLGVESALFPLHFEFGPDGLTSPQVPLANERDVAEASGVDGAVIERAAARLQQLAPRLSRSVLEPKVGGAEAELPMLGCNVVAPEAPLQTKQSVQEYSNRQRAVVQNVMSQQGDGNAASASAWSGVGEIVGPMVPVWIDAVPVPLMVFARRVRVGADTRLQGVVVDWPQLERELVALVADQFAVAGTRLVRCEQPTAAEQASMLASVPARLEARCDDAIVSGLPLPWILGATWGVTLLGLSVLGFTLRAAIGFGERRARFASAVTHELRTPLTTFRMYSEMLADGMITDPAAQREYLATLQRESDRLSRVVENVLVWSRLEEGRFTSRREDHRVQDLVDRLVATLQRRLADAGMTLRVVVDDAARDAVLRTDEDAVGQILFNLVDNAAKYAKGTGAVELCVRRVGGNVRLEVRDRGPGVPRSHQRGIFAPFDRGSVPTSSNEVPGVGLGLPLARGLARDLGGDLELDEVVADGACFALTLPAA